MSKVSRQMPVHMGRVAVTCREHARAHTSDETCGPLHYKPNTGLGLLGGALRSESLQQVWRRVKANKGAAGVNGQGIEQTAQMICMKWPTIRRQLLQGSCRPSPVRRVTIPIPDEGERELGIPTVTDRLIQQGLRQVVQPILDPIFSEHSYGL